MDAESSLALEQVPGLEVSELCSRWKRARTAAVGRGPSVLDTSRDQVDALTEESKMLERVPEVDRSGVLKRVFDHSRALGLSASRRFGVKFELQDFQRVLEQSGSPCFQGVWEEREGARVLRRNGCEGATCAGAFACDYWREALDGLVMGLGESERLARHSSVGHGDSLCVDVLFCDSLSHARNSRAPVPPEMLLKLAVIQEGFAASGVALTFDGLSEGILYFQMTSQGRGVCGAGGRLLQETLVQKVRALYPGLGLQDSSPLAVMGEKA